MGRRYPAVTAGEWVQPTRTGYRFMCCDCGLVHIMDFRLVDNTRGSGKKIQFRAHRDNRATAGARRSGRRPQLADEAKPSDRLTLGAGLRVVSVGTARVEDERRVRVPLVLGDADGATASFALTIALEGLLGEDDS